MSIFVDLHMHSTTSDGTVPAGQILDCIHPDQYEKVIISLTDHDNIAGISSLISSASMYENVVVIPGVEISTRYHGVEIHMLGYGIDFTDTDFCQKLCKIRNSRNERNEKILQKFIDIGIDMPKEIIIPKDDKSVGRLTFAKWLYNHGYVSEIEEAFTLYLDKGKKCYVDRFSYSLEDAIKMILAANGVPVLAHPMQYKKLNKSSLEQLVIDAKALGLQGIETYYTEFSDEETKFVESLAKKYSLFRTGGSDFHGDNKPNYKIGFGWGNLGNTFDRIEYQRIIGNVSQDVVNMNIILNNSWAIEPEYTRKIFEQRAIGGRGSSYDYNAKELVYRFRHSVFEKCVHDAVKSPFICYKSMGFQGNFGLIKLCELPQDIFLLADDYKNSGFISLIYNVNLIQYTKYKKRLAETYVITKKKNDLEILVTFHPGEPITPSTISTSTIIPGTKITVKDALSLGFIWAKVALEEDENG